ncbi:MAG: hypothetical protein ACJ73J_00940 [Actinomycetes bacterium]
MAAVSSGSDSEHLGRSAAYAELVSAVLDLRNPGSTHDFDALVAAAVADGRLAEPLARELRWLQRQTVRDVVEHAAHVLPATLVALEGEERSQAAPAGTGNADLPVDAELAKADPAAAEGHDKPDAPGAGTSSVAEEPDEEPPAPLVDLTARRLLVAGLRPIDDPPFP